MLKIAVIAPTEIPARRANTLQVMKMTQAITSLGYQAHLIAPSLQPKKASKGVDPSNQPVPVDQNSLPGPDWDELALHYGLRNRFPIDLLPANPRLRGYDFSLRAVRWARRWEADLIYTRLPQAAFLASNFGMPTLYEVHDMPRGSLNPWMFRRFLRGRSKRRLVVITRALANDLHQAFDAPLEPPFTLISPDGVDLDRYADLPDPQQARLTLAEEGHLSQPLPIHPDRFTAGYTGHLYPGRGIHLILEMAARLTEVTFLIVGGEPGDVSRLQTEVNARELANVLLTGFVPNAELPLYQAACDLLLMPYQQRVAASSGGDISRYLSPMKAFEYLACGRAILSSDLPVLREVLNPGNAILLPSNEIGAWIEAVQALREDSGLGARLAAQASKDALLYTWEARAARLLEGFEGIAGEVSL